MISNGSATTSQRTVLTLRDTSRNLCRAHRDVEDVSEPRTCWSRSRHARDCVSSAPVRRYLRSSRGTDRRLANPPRSAALAERALGIIMLPRITVTRTWSDNDVAQLTFEVCDGVSVFIFGNLEPGARDLNREPTDYESERKLLKDYRSTTSARQINERRRIAPTPFR